MNFGQIKASYSALKSKNMLQTYANAGLVLMLLVSLFVNLQKDTIVVNNLNEACQDSAIGSGWMNEANHRRIGIFLSERLGNITPDNAKYVEENVLPYAAPEVYQVVDDLIAEQLASLVAEEIVMEFNAERSFVEDGKTFVTGKGKMKGVTGISVPYIRTYEFVFNVENYTPTFDYMNVYDDVPRDAKWRAKHQKKDSK